MDRGNIVLDVEIDHNGVAHRASYFVENHTIHANIDGRLLIAPQGSQPAAETVKALLLGYWQQKGRKQRQLNWWRREDLAEEAQTAKRLVPLDGAGTP